MKTKLIYIFFFIASSNLFSQQDFYLEASLGGHRNIVQNRVLGNFSTPLEEKLIFAKPEFQYEVVLGYKIKKWNIAIEAGLGNFQMNHCFNCSSYSKIIPFEGRIKLKKTPLRVKFFPFSEDSKWQINPYLGISLNKLTHRYPNDKISPRIIELPFYESYTLKHLWGTKFISVDAGLEILRRVNNRTKLFFGLEYGLASREKNGLDVVELVHQKLKRNHLGELIELEDETIYYRSIIRGDYIGLKLGICFSFSVI